MSVLLLYSVSAHADVVTLKNGRILEGEVREDGEFYTVNLAYGSVRVAKRDVDTVVKKVTPLDDYRVKSEALAAQAKDGGLKGSELAQAWYELARWCESSQLPRSREECLRKALDADADHAATRTALGYVKLNDAWVTPAQKMQALGLVPYKDRWVEPQAKIEAEKVSQGVADAERARQIDIAQRETELKIREAELEKKRLETELLRGQLLQQNTPPLPAQPRYITPGDPFWVPGYGWSYPPVVVPSTPVPTTPTPTPSTPATTEKKNKDTGVPYTSPLHSGNSGPGIPVLR